MHGAAATCLIKYMQLQAGVVLYLNKKCAIFNQELDINNPISCQFLSLLFDPIIIMIQPYEVKRKVVRLSLYIFS